MKNWQDFKNNPNKYHFLAYSVSFFFYGTILNGLGPLIPYLAQIQQRNQTDYKFFFLARTIGFVVGAVCIKVLQSRISFHNTLMIFSTLIFASFTFFSSQNDMNIQAIYLLLASTFSSIIEIILNTSMLVSQAGKYQQFYLQIAHSMLAIGGFLSPFVVLIFQENCYIFFGLMIFLVIPAYYTLQTPQIRKQTKADQLFEAANIVDQIKRISHQLGQRKSQKNALIQKKTLVIYLICFLSFLYIGQVVAFGGWISSCVILQGIATKQEATSFTSVFWASVTIMRIILAFVNIKPSKKIKILIVSQIFFTFLVIIIVEVFRQLKFAAYFASITIGMSISALFGLFFILPSQFGIQMTSEQSSSFILYGQLGQGPISMFVGYLMDWFSPNMLYYSMLVIGISMLLVCNKVTSLLLVQKSTNSYNQQTNHITSNLNQQMKNYQGKQKLLQNNKN